MRRSSALPFDRLLSHHWAGGRDAPSPFTRKPPKQKNGTHPGPWMTNHHLQRPDSFLYSIFIPLYIPIRVNLRALERARTSARDWGARDRPKSTRVARPRRFERQKSSESVVSAATSNKSRPKRSLKQARDAIFDDFGSILGSIFVVFRGNIARAMQLAARMAEL